MSGEDRQDLDLAFRDGYIAALATANLKPAGDELDRALSKRGAIDPRHANPGQCREVGLHGQCTAYRGHPGAHGTVGLPPHLAPGWADDPRYIAGREYERALYAASSAQQRGAYERGVRDAAKLAEDEDCGPFAAFVRKRLLDEPYEATPCACEVAKPPVKL